MNTNVSKAASALNIIIIIAMLVVIGLMVGLPFLLGIDTIRNYFTALIPTIIFCYIAGVLSLWFFVILRKLVLSVCAGNPFVHSNVLHLKRLSLSLLLLMFDFIFIFIFMPSISVLLCVCILLLGVFCAQVLAYLIKRAAEYREDADLTV